MPDTKVRQNTFDIFPYDFVKENQVIANNTEDGYEVISPNKISPNLYHEIYKFLKNEFTLIFSGRNRPSKSLKIKLIR